MTHFHKQAISDLTKNLTNRNYAKKTNPTVMMSPIRISLVAVIEIRLALKGIGPVSLIPIPVFHQ